MVHSLMLYPSCAWSFCGEGPGPVLLFWAEFKTCEPRTCLTWGSWFVVYLRFRIEISWASNSKWGSWCGATDLGQWCFVGKHRKIYIWCSFLTNTEVPWQLGWIVAMHWCTDRCSDKDQMAVWHIAEVETPHGPHWSPRLLNSSLF